MPSCYGLLGDNTEVLVAIIGHVNPHDGRH
jgi:hypothetical protein